MFLTLSAYDKFRDESILIVNFRINRHFQLSVGTPIPDYQ